MTNIDEIANNMRAAAADRVNLDSELQSAINASAKDIVIQGYKPDKNISELDAGKTFLKDVMGKCDNEIQNLELLSVSFTRTDSDYPAGMLSFKSDTSGNSLLKDKRKCREKGLKLKESVPLVYRDMQRKYRSEAYTKYIKGYATWIGFEGSNYVMRYKHRDNAAKGMFYQWTTYNEFKLCSIRATGNGFVTKKIDTPLDLPDTVLVQYKEAKSFSETLVNRIKEAVLAHLENIGITTDSIVAMGSYSAIIKTTQDKASKVKAIVDVHITAAQGATITII